MPDEVKFKTVTLDGVNYADFDAFLAEYNRREHFSLLMPDILKKAMRELMNNTDWYADWAGK